MALEVAAFGPSDEPGVRAHLRRSGVLADWVVVEQERSGRIVSTCGLLAHRMVLDGVALPGRARSSTWPPTRRSSDGAGRAQFDWHHRRSAARGDLAQFITGIPYLYRRFGYGYGLDYPPSAIPSLHRGAPPHPIQSRPGHHASPPMPIARRSGHRRRARPMGLRVERDATAWDVIFAMSRDNCYEHLQVAERDGQVVGWTRTQHKPADRPRVPAAVGGPGRPAAVDHLGHGGRRPARGRRRRAGRVRLPRHHLQPPPGRVRPSWAGRSATTTGSTPEYPTRWHCSTGSARPCRHGWAGRATPTRRASWSSRCTASGVALTYDHGRVTDVGRAPGIEDPYADGDVGVAPDLFGALVFGRFGAVGLEQRADDVTLGRHRGLMEVLFPQLESDVIGDF